jgi:hypothetical protein
MDEFLTENEVHPYRMLISLWYKYSSAMTSAADTNLHARNANRITRFISIGLILPVALPFALVPAPRGMFFFFLFFQRTPGARRPQRSFVIPAYFCITNHCKMLSVTESGVVVRRQLFPIGSIVN